MNNKKYIENLTKEYYPDKSEKGRIKDKVFARLNLEAPKKRFNLIDEIIMKKKILMGTLTMIAITLFVGLPLAVNYGKDSNISFSGIEPIDTQQEDVPVDKSNDQVSSQITNEIYQIGIDNYQGNTVEEDVETTEEERAKEKNAFLYLQIENLGDSINRIYDLTENIEGYVISSNYSTEEEKGIGYITIRVPSDKFDYTIKELRGYAITVLSETTNIVDLQNQITNNENTLIDLRKELDEEYTNLEKETKESVKRLIQTRIDQIENQIKIYEDQAVQLEQKTSFSTISLTLTQDTTVIVEDDIKDVFSKAWETTLEILEFWGKLAVSGILIIPAVLLPVIIIVIVVKIRKKIKSRKG